VLTSTKEDNQDEKKEEAAYKPAEATPTPAAKPPKEGDLSITSLITAK